MDDESDRRDPGGEGWWPDPEREPTPPKQRERTRPPRGLSSPNRPRPSGRYSLFVGLAFVAVIVIALLNLIGGDDDAGILGAGYGTRGMPLAAFAVPDALGGVDADANVAQDDCETSRNPCPADERRTPACRIDAEGAIRVCDLFDRPLAISFWFTRGGDCLPSQDAFDQMASRYEGRVNFLSINIRDDPETVAGIATDRGWSIPVGVDRDGAVSNLYRIGVCPSIAFAYPGGILHAAEIRGEEGFTPAELTDLIDDLVATSAARAQESN